MDSPYKQLIINQLKNYKLSPSHDLYHLELVLKYADQLHEIHEGDWDVISAAVLLHDLGRIYPDKDDEESIKSSVNLAIPILENIGFPSEKIDSVLEAIEDHDKPEVSPRSLEGRILKDADFLSGFGAWGVLRISMWMGETKDGIDGYFDLVTNFMPERIRGLEFNESRITAQKQFVFAKLFTNMLLKSPELAQSFPGKYIILEGNGGVGKTTQAKILVDRLSNFGMKSLLVWEPSNIFRMFENLWQEKYQTAFNEDGTLFRRYLIVGDRDKTIKETILPALRDDFYVVSDRSFISMLVYQCKNEFDRLFTSFVHSFQPTPDLIIIYDTDEYKSYERMKARKEIGPFDKLNELKKYRPIFLEVAKSDHFGCPVEVIDSSGEIDEVAEATWQVLIKYKIIDSQLLHKGHHDHNIT